MTKYEYHLSVGCGLGLPNPLVVYHHSSQDRPPDDSSIQKRTIDRAKKIISTDSACLGCLASCHIRDLSTADLDTVKSILYGLTAVKGEIPSQT